MRKLLAFLLLISLARGQVAFDVSLQQVDSGGARFNEVLVSPAASSLLGFSAGKIVSGVTVGAGLSLVAGNLSATGSGAGDVSGPSSATDNALARFDLTTGKVLQNSTAILTDAGALSGITTLAASAGISGTTGTFSALTSGRVPYVSTAGLLTDAATLTYATGFGIGAAASGSATDTLTRLYVRRTAIETTGVSTGQHNSVEWTANTTNNAWITTAFLGDVIHNGTASGGAGHYVGVIGRAADTSSGAMAMYGVEGKIVRKGTSDAGAAVWGLSVYNGTTLTGRTINVFQAQAEIYGVDGVTPVTNGTTISYRGYAATGGDSTLDYLAFGDLGQKIYTSGAIASGNTAGTGKTLTISHDGTDGLVATSHGALRLYAEADNYAVLQTGAGLVPLSEGATLGINGNRWAGSFTTANLSGTLTGVAGTFSGAVSGTTGTFSSTLSGTTHTATADYVSNRTVAANHGYYMSRSGALRWGLRQNSTTESGSNAGADFAITRYDDAGSSLGDALTIERATGAADFSGTITAGSGNTAVTDAAGKVLSAALNTVATANGGTGNVNGTVATLTTARNINGVAFDGSANITVTAAGSTLSDTVTVAKGGTGATTLTGILIGNGTGAVTAATSSTVGQIPRVTGANTYAFGALDLADTDAVTGVLPVANFTTGTPTGSKFVRDDGVLAVPTGSGTVTVVGAGSLTSTALVTGGGTTTLQTPSATSTLDSSGNQSLAGDLTVVGADVTIASAGVKLTGSNGSLTFLGLGSGQDEDLKLDLDTTANTATVTSSTGVTTLAMGAIGITTTGTNSIGPLVDAVDGTTPLNNINQVVAAGTAYTLTASYASLDFGTTDPVLTIANAGTYAIYVNVQFNLVGATYATYDSVTIKLRRTNNTAADLAGSTFGTFIPTITTITAIGPQLTVGPVKYVTTNTNDTVTVQGVLNSTPSVGSVTSTACTITAIRMY